MWAELRESMRDGEAARIWSNGGPRPGGAVDPDASSSCQRGPADRRCHCQRGTGPLPSHARQEGSRRNKLLSSPSPTDIPCSRTQQVSKVREPGKCGSRGKFPGRGQGVNGTEHVDSP